MSEENRSIGRRAIEEIWNARNPDAVNKLYAENFINHTPPKGMSADRDGFREWVINGTKAFPDLRFSIIDMISEDDKLVMHWSNTGTHAGEFMGVEASNNKISAAGVTISRIVDGKIAESWDYWDGLDLMQQLGVEISI